MKFVAVSLLGLSLALANPAAAAPAAMSAPGAAAPTPAHVKALQDLLAAMQVEKTLRSVAARSRYGSEAQRQAVFARIAQTPPAEVARRLAPALAPAISADTAAEMTRFYQSPYGKRVLHEKYNSSAQIQMPGMKPVVPPEEKKERKRAAYVKASKELADAAPLIEREAFKLLQKMLAEKR